MKKLFIIANWKSNVSSAEATTWLQEFQISNFKSPIPNKEVIVCPPFTLLESLHSYFKLHTSNFKLGAQDVSPFPKGAYTGAIAAEMLKEFVTYTIIGHSERRKYFHEDYQTLENKVGIALENEITPIFCIQDENTPIPEKVSIVAYEPIFAIGTGQPDTPESADKVASKVKERTGIKTVLYGGSVTGENVRSFTETEHIDGVLVGSASLHADSFSRIIQNA